MSDYKELLKTEAYELRMKVIKLDAFIQSDAFESLHSYVKALLKVQLSTMIGYMRALDEQVKYFETNESFPPFSIAGRPPPYQED